ncbi:cytochrome c biogenesis protein ResB [Georgenia faecalis]|uniref:Cytochrome c biogenesis protein ResB n=1 Tax=Georgenia faecalis TaxID=2483799 RepID=A0ABV9D7Y8_9MICO|nr:cytochrome c biogenesis protein ResB [Georgenia faecalis]
MAYRPEGLKTGLDLEPETTPAAAGDRPAGAPAPAGIGLRGWVRWAWRQLTSMRVALLLLMLLAVAALPGSFFPQLPQDPSAVAQYRTDHPALAPWLERLGFFDVYAAPWFAAVYLLLFVSLIGCILPRVGAHLRALRAAPPRVPRRFERFPTRGERTTTASADEVRTAVLARLRGRYRTTASPEGISAERGYLRETGNIVFHLSLVGVLVAFGYGQLVSYRGQAIVVEGQGFANALVDYDSFTPGTLFDEDRLEPFSFTLDSFESEFTVDAQARDFTAHVTVTQPGGEVYTDEIKVNHPLRAGGANVYLSGNGYAPRITVRDADGELAFSQAVPFLPEDGVYTSRGVVKVPDVSEGLEQLGFSGYLLPTAVADPSGGLRSVHPQPGAPLLVLTAYAGDLGLDDGEPQNAYELDTEAMTQLVDADGAPLTLLLEPGQSVDLPDGQGTVTFEELPRFVALDLRHDPSLGLLLASAVLAMVGLAASLFVPRRRLWLRLESDADGRTVVRAAALARGEDPGLRADLDRVLDAVPRGAGEPAEPHPQEET